MTRPPLTAEHALRGELPALALLLPFVALQHRQQTADILLLWLEGRRASCANEGMVAAVRLAWWRDNLRDAVAHTGGHDADVDTNTDTATSPVPLCMRLHRHQQNGSLSLASIADTIDGMIRQRLAGESAEAVLPSWHAALADYLGEGEGAGVALACLDQALLGKAQKTLAAGTQRVSLPIRLIHWLAAETTRLDYPRQCPWLAMQMTWLVLWRRI